MEAPTQSKPEGSWREIFERERETAERRILKRILEETGGNKSLAARYLNWSYKTMLQKIKKLKLSDQDWK